MKTNDDADLAEASPRDVDNRGLTLHSGILEPSLNEQHVIDAVGFLKQYLLRDEGPEFVQVDSGLVEVGVVGVHVEVPHANLNNKCHLRTKVFSGGLSGQPFRSIQDGTCQS